MSLLNPQTVVTEQRLADFYAAIYNYLGSTNYKAKNAGKTYNAFKVVLD